MVATFSPQSLRATHRNEVLLSQWRNTALLFTCCTMYNEGLSILYSHNKLHFPILTKGVMLNQRQGSSFSLLMSVSIDYSYTFLSAWDVYRRQVFWTMEVARQVDSTISKGVRQLTAGCPRLKTLTLHIVSFAAFAHLTTLAAHDMCKTTIALSALTDRLDCLTVVGMPERRGLHGVFRPRDGASMVATGYAGSEYALLNSIAPVARWEQEARQVLWEPHVPWPGLKVSNDFIFRDNQIASHEPFRLYEHGNEHRRGIAPRSMKAQKEQIWHLRRSKRDAAGDGTATPAH